MNAALRPIRTEAELGLVDVYTQSRQALPGGEGITKMRVDAFNQFVRAGLPHSRVEAWKYTDLRRLMRDAKPLALAPDAKAKENAGARAAGGLLAGLGFRRLVIVDGAFVAGLSDLDHLEAGLHIRSMADALASDEPLLSQGLGAIVPADEPALALNTALAGDGVVVTVSPDASIERPIQLVFVNTCQAMMVTRSLVVVGRGALMTLIETHEGRDQLDYQVNTVLQLVIGDEARVDHIKITREGDAALHIATLLAHIGARTRFNQLGFTAGGAVIRNQAFVLLAGEDAVADLRGLSLLAGKQHADTTLALDHAARGGQSRELFKSVVDDSARAVFQGKIAVRSVAQKTDAKMMSRGLLLSDHAEANAKPELEIFADDVQCGHGATTGTLDDQLKFYLMARGIPEKQAEALLIQAFAAEVVESIEHQGIREALVDAIAGWLGQRG